jgi:hypothetical protein
LHEIEQLTLWELNDLMAYWKDYPPTHVLVAAYLMGGGKKAHTSSRKGQKFEELSHAVSAAGGTLINKLPAFYKNS